jgi:carbonic anhydrase
MDSRSTPLTPTPRRGSAARRQRFGGLLAAQLAIACGPAAAPGQEKPITPEAALQRLKDGNTRFVHDKVVKKDTGPARRLELAKGQSPIAVILTCADSRVAPELLFNKGLGDLFVLRVAGNVVDDSHGMLGSAEYAVLHLKVPLIVVMGHESCGAVTAVLKGESAPGNLSRLLKSIRVGTDLPKDKKAALAAATQANTLFQATEMIRQSAILKEFADSGRVRIVPAVYSLTTGEVTWLDPVRTKPGAPKAKSKLPAEEVREK